MKEKKGGSQFQTEHLIMVVICKMCLFSLYFMKYLMLITLHALLNNWSSFVYTLALRKFDLRGQWSATPKNRGGQRKLRGGQV